jgi:hypothetical protein
MAHEKNEDKTFVLKPQISLPRGYSSNSNQYFDIISGKVEYTFPFLYPDWSIGPIVYIKRFHAGIFCDMAKIKYTESSENQIIRNDIITSVGGSIAGEINFLRFYIPFTPKLTISYLTDIDAFHLKFGIEINTSVF